MRYIDIGVGVRASGARPFGSNPPFPSSDAREVPGCPISGHGINKSRYVSNAVAFRRALSESEDACIETFPC